MGLWGGEELFKRVLKTPLCMTSKLAVSQEFDEACAGSTVRLGKLPSPAKTPPAAATVSHRDWIPGQGGQSHGGMMLELCGLKESTNMAFCFIA